jgi:hypothetical protein
MRKGICLALHPLFLVSLAILLINDHILKNLYPGFVTGKLSDFAGLFLFPVFLYILFEGFFRSKKRLIFMHILMGLVFIVWKLASVEILLAKINELTSIPMPGRVKDPSDLIALITLPLSYKFLNKSESFIELNKKKYIMSRLIIILSGVAVLGTSKIYTYKNEPEYTIVSSKDIANMIFLFEQSLRENDFVITDRVIENGSDFLYYADIEYPLRATYKVEGSDEIYEYDFWKVIHCEISIAKKDTVNQLSLESVRLEILNASLDDKEIADIVWNKIIYPYEKKLNVYENSY